ncbi:n-acetylglucosaminyl-ph osphatidylinositol de-n-acetylase, putative [Babesia caballi]|uniref:N-acetylglucosaminylphosphatidylinositol deacetylase n=1 Tax=Babesia caballi TaxID=5871 RepID=A0AAV4LLT1_BABCB|nr:n-acetylglucosaminyl-ph osphatidylinositol de-n-acetylase, putative [Babesia caballi]
MSQWQSYTFFILGALLFLLLMKLWFTKVNSNFTKELLAHFDVENGDVTKSVAFVLAHPDDESMFFTPLLELLRVTPEFAHQHIKLNLLSLSKGKCGDQRTFELEEVCHKYNISCSILDEVHSPDSPNFWDANKVSERVEAFVKDKKAAVLFTFDQYGASGHPNHISVHNAVINMKARYPDVTVMRLHTYGLVAKYTALLAILRAMFTGTSVIKFSPMEVMRNMKIHHSQWKPHLYVWSFFGSYSYCNTFHRL